MTGVTEVATNTVNAISKNPVLLFLMVCQSDRARVRALDSIVEQRDVGGDLQTTLGEPP
jgi:hypothetical protein